MLKIKDHPALKQRFRFLIQEGLGLAYFKEEGKYFRFRFEGMIHVLEIDPEDAPFIWIACFRFYSIKQPNAEQLSRADVAINRANLLLKGVKVVRNLEPDSDGSYAVSSSISFLVEDAESHSAEALERYLNMIKVGRRHFVELYEQEDESEPEQEQEQKSETVQVVH